MAKKTSVKRVSDKSKGKEIEKKLIKDLRSPEKTFPKKKINKNVSRKTTLKVRVKTEKKTDKAKGKTKDEVEKKTKKRLILKKDEGKAKTGKVAPARLIKKKTAAKREEKILPESAKKPRTKKIADKPLRKVKVETKTKAKIKAKVEVKAERKEKPEKKIRKTASKIGKKVPAEKTKKIPPKKPVKKTSEKVKVEDKITVKKKTKAKPEKTVKKVIAKVQEKAFPAGVKEIEARKPVKAAMKEKEEVKVSPSIEEKIPLIPLEGMPSEYGENEITLMIVDPYKLFTFWEVSEDTLKIFKGDLKIRLYDITGVDFDKSDANSYLDLPVTERIGRTYIDAVPEKEFIADIGIVYEGIFIAIARSNIVSTPRASVSEGEGLLPPKLYETGIRIGY